MKKFILFIAVIVVSFFSFAQSSHPREMKSFIDKLMSKMTLEEKVGQLGQASVNMVVTGNTGELKYRQLIKDGHVGSVLNALGVKKTRELQQLTLEHSRLKIPLIFGLDVIETYRTAFPLPLAQSSSWDLARIEKTARMLAAEASADGIDWTFAPMVDISRDPRWGRVAEGGGEDPWLGSKIAIARVHGFQGQDVSHPDSILGCVKHFAGYGASMAGRDYNTVDMSDREFFEVYLPPYEAAVKAGAATVMTSFNDLNGVPSTANRWLLTDLLRKKWGFKGMVITDYASTNELVKHGVATDEKEAALMSINAGVDMDMESHAYSRFLVDLVKQGKVSQASVDQAVRRVLELKYKRGLFKDPFRDLDGKRSAELWASKEHQEHARDMGRRSIVLLKNEGKLLPLTKGTVALVGPLAFTRFGRNAPDQEQMKKHITMVEGLTAVNNGRIKILSAKGALLPREEDPSIPVPAAPTADGAAIPTPPPRSTLSPSKLLDEAVSVAKKADVVVLALGEPEEFSGEAASRSHIRIPKNQQTLLKAIHQLGKPIVLVLSNGRPLALEEEAPMVGTILETWFLGSQAGLAIADVLMGDYNPSGKLPMTFPYNEGQIPIFYSVKNTGRPLDPKDKYSTKYLDVSNEPLFPFGWGLSYTDFAYSDLKVSNPKLKWGQKLLVDVTVANKGDFDGEETVQLYIRDMVSTVTRPLKQLRGFQKVVLKKGETKTVHLELTLEDLKYYDQNMKWTIEPGAFKVMVGGNSRDLLAADFTLLK